MFHPTWDEWKQRAANLSNEKTNKSKQESVSSQHTNTFNKHQQQDNKNTNNHQTKSLSSSTKTYTEDYYSNRMTQDKNESSVYSPASPILIRNSNTNQLEYVNESSLRRKRSPRHYPVAGIDFLPIRPPSPAEFSTCTLAKQPPLDLKTENETKKFDKTEPVNTELINIDTKPIVLESVQQKKIKTILSTRKESAPNLTGWRTESDSDSDVQNRLLARASGSIPIEYISIRRDPKPKDKQIDKNKKSITTGTNTSSDRGKRIAATNTNQDELPQYNLHVSLDSLLVKSRQEASTTTELKNKNASTETNQIGHKDAGTVTDVEKSPSPVQKSEPKQKEKVFYHTQQRKSRFAEWETAAAPIPITEKNYRLEIMTKSPSKNRQTKCQQTFYHHQTFNNFRSQPRKTNLNYSINQAVRLEDDDKIIFGKNSSSSYDHFTQETYSKRSGSFPCLINRQVFFEPNFDSVNTRRYVKQTHLTNYSKPFVIEKVTYCRPEYEQGIIPLFNKKSQQHSFDLNDFSNQFSEFNKFKQIFGDSQMVSTKRYYKYSQTNNDIGKYFDKTTEPFISSHGHQIVNQNFNNSFSSSSSSSATKVPIVEIPITPTSTIGKSQYFNGPIITNMSSSNASTINLNSSYCASSMQHKSSRFEPVVQRVTSPRLANSSSTRTKFDKEQEFIKMNKNVESERRFKPINESITREAHFRSSSSNGLSIPLSQLNTKNSIASFDSNAQSSARKNFSTSYEYASSSKK